MPVHVELRLCKSHVVDHAVAARRIGNNAIQFLHMARQHGSSA
jgi:hypothetical protein